MVIKVASYKESLPTSCSEMLAEKNGTHPFLICGCVCNIFDQYVGLPFIALRVLPVSLVLNQSE